MATKAQPSFNEAQYESWLNNMQFQYQKIVFELKQERRHQKITQRHLATMLGIPQPRISEFESCKETQKSLLWILLYAGALGMTLDLTLDAPYLKKVQ